MEKNVKEVLKEIKDISQVMYFIDALITSYEENSNMQIEELSWAKNDGFPPTFKVLLKNR